MGMNSIESLGLRSEGLLLHEHKRRISIDQSRLQPEGMRTGRPVTGRCLRISAGKEGDIVALTNEFFRNIGDDAFGTSIEPGGDAFPKRCDLCDFHVGLSFLQVMLDFMS